MIIPHKWLDCSNSLSVKGLSNESKAKNKEWGPHPQSGQDKKIKFVEEINLFSLPLKYFKIIDFFLGASLKEELLNIMPVQKPVGRSQGLCH